jgi:hypothetical protein
MMTVHYALVLIARLAYLAAHRLNEGDSTCD